MAFDKMAFPLYRSCDSQPLTAPKEEEPRVGFMQEQGQECRDCLCQPLACESHTEVRNQPGRTFGRLVPQWLPSSVITQKWTRSFCPVPHTQPFPAFAHC